MPDLTPPADPRLDRRKEFDERSRNFTVRAYLEQLPPAKRMRGRTWSPGPVLDQGQEGACVGFACTHRRNGLPKRFGYTAEDAQRVYKLAQTLDIWPGEDYDGTSVLAGMKAGQQMHWWEEYRWCGAGSQRVLDDVLDALDDIGPVVIGIDWLSGMMQPRPSGLLDCSGRIVGGHAVCVVGYRMKARLRGEQRPLEVAVIQQSWGTDHGAGAYGQLGGFVFMKLDDLERLLHQQGEAVVPIERD
jgi:hypothetical protein